MKRSIGWAPAARSRALHDVERRGSREGTHVVAPLGRRESACPRGHARRATRVAREFSERLRVVEKVRTEGVQAHAARSWGPALRLLSEVP